MAHSCGNLPRDLNFRGRSEKYHIGLELINEAVGDGGKTFRQPAFGGAVSGAGRERDTKRGGMNARFLKARFGGFRSVGSKLQTDFRHRRQFIEPTDTPKQLKIIIRFVRGDFASARNANGASEQEAASVPRIADAFRDSGAPSEPRGGECILQKQGGIEMLAPKLGGNIFHGEGTPRGSVERNNLICEWLTAIKIRDPGTRENRDIGFGPVRANGFERGYAHHGVADPVRGPNQELHDEDTGLLRAIVSRMVCQRASSSLKRKAIFQKSIGRRLGRSGVKSWISFSVHRRASAPAAKARDSNSERSASV